MIVLDTHALIWWVGATEKLSKKARALIVKHENDDRSILISSITAWEIAMLVIKGRLTLNMDVSAWLTQVGRISAVKFVPVDNTVSVKSATLPGAFHKDPADRMIVALARQGAYPLITADKKMHAYKYVKTVW